MAKADFLTQMGMCRPMQQPVSDFTRGRDGCPSPGKHYGQWAHQVSHRRFNPLQVGPIPACKVGGNRRAGSRCSYHVDTAIHGARLIPFSAWIQLNNSAAIEIQRQRSEIWNK